MNVELCILLPCQNHLIDLLLGQSDHKVKVKKVSSQKRAKINIYNRNKTNRANRKYQTSSNMLAIRAVVAKFTWKTRISSRFIISFRLNKNYADRPETNFSPIFNHTFTSAEQQSFIGQPLSRFSSVTSSFIRKM